MPSELVTQILLSVLVISGLAFHERVAAVIASLETNPDLLDPDEIE
ncbi:hypothetical protein [Haladaptatus halobius]|nr:hypothetical protein [Haladaptatus halobius]